MNQKKSKRLAVLICAAALAQFLGGCATIKKITAPEKKILPRMLVFPFKCTNNLVAVKINEGFMDQITRNVESFDMTGFASFLSSHPVNMPGYIEMEISSGSAVSTGSSTFIMPGIPRAGTLTKPLTMSVGTMTQITPEIEQFAKDLFKKDDVRSEFYRQSKIDYCVAGTANEQRLSELEAGNLITAENAEMRLLDLKTGDILLEANFKQGMFEIVAPERIGSQFASKVTRKLWIMKKDEKQKVKEGIGRKVID